MATMTTLAPARQIVKSQISSALSIYLDLARFLAAVAVVVCHMEEGLYRGGFPFAVHLGAEAVGIFFVLSGFVIAFVCDGRERDARTYAISRMSRMYSVVIPCLLLTVVLDLAGRHVSPDFYTHLWLPLGSPIKEIGKFLVSLTFVNFAWNWGMLPGTDGPFWSLCFEVPYYLMFGMLFFGKTRLKYIATAALLLFYGPRIALLFPLWLLGVVLYSQMKRLSLSPSGGRVILAAFAIAWLASEEIRHHYGIGMNILDASLRSNLQLYWAGFLFAGTVVGVNYAEISFKTVERPVRWLAGATFTIYLLHYPLLVLFASQRLPVTHIRWVLLLIVTCCLCLFVAEFTERRKKVWRELFGHVIPARS